MPPLVGAAPSTAQVDGRCVHSRPLPSFTATTGLNAVNIGQTLEAAMIGGLECNVNYYRPHRQLARCNLVARAHVSSVTCVFHAIPWPGIKHEIGLPCCR